MATRAKNRIKTLNDIDATTCTHVAHYCHRGNAAEKDISLELALFALEHYRQYPEQIN